ncbi:hypothetical protein AALO_G00173020 [Alosa alosa]|uniref:EF-hand domain-containing protein n=2 Tax=Alosa alosa TaxID=278164 RepID=A0AAV6GBI0_9TELE|nr:hypothetical protein AALO_G00173020 [Alosa alosa]
MGWDRDMTAGRIRTWVPVGTWTRIWCERCSLLRRCATAPPTRQKSDSSADMSRSRLEQAIMSLVEVYEEYAGKDDKKHQLSQAELAELLQKELASPEFQGKIDPEDIQEAMSKLDKNHDGEVNFREFGMMVGLLARGVYRHKRGKGKGKKKDNE